MKAKKRIWIIRFENGATLCANGTEKEARETVRAYEEKHKTKCKHME